MRSGNNCTDDLLNTFYFNTDEYDLEMPMDQPLFSPSDQGRGLFRPLNIDVIDPVVYSSPFLSRLQASAIVPSTRRHRRGKDAYTFTESLIHQLIHH